MQQDIKSLHPLEVKVLLYVKKDTHITVGTIEKELRFKPGQSNQAISWLAAKDLIHEISRQTRIFYELTEIGREWIKKGTPDERIIDLLYKEGPMGLPEIAEHLFLEKKDVGSAFGILSKEQIVSMGPEKKAELIENLSSNEKDNKLENDEVAGNNILKKVAEISPRLKTIRTLLDRAAENKTLDEHDLVGQEPAVMTGISKKRGATGVPFKIIERDEVVYVLTPPGEEAQKSLKKLGITGEEIGALAPEMLAQGSWKGKQFREYNIQTPPSRVLLGRKNPYAKYLEQVKDKLTSLGFEEFDGPLVETEFWNGDALFMPQFHSARDIHDVYYVKNPSHAKGIEQPYLDQVAATHENGWETGSRGWGYAFDRDFTRRLILRSQGTVLSAKQLPKAKIPGKYFAIVRCFRYDQVDATHGADFYQTEGIVLGENVNLRTHLGLLKMFAEEVAGAEEVKYVPGYFPFTEPSIEIHIKHPVLGWFEMGGSGIFRPEVTKPLGIDVPVLAWGLGIDRMALMQLGLNDLRELFSPNIEHVRLRRSN